MTTITTTILPRVTADNAEWMTLKAAATALQALQEQDGSIADSAAHSEAASLVATVTDAIAALAPHFPPHDARYLELLVQDFGRWVEGGFGVPDFLDSLQRSSPPRSSALTASSTWWFSPPCTRRTAAPTGWSKPS